MHPGAEWNFRIISFLDFGWPETVTSHLDRWITE
jgi:hypothetical protein